jgi:hypothetical protein
VALPSHSTYCCWPFSLVVVVVVVVVVVAVLLPVPEG